MQVWKVTEDPFKRDFAKRHRHPIWCADAESAHGEHRWDELLGRGIQGPGSANEQTFRGSRARAKVHKKSSAVHAKVVAICCYASINNSANTLLGMTG